MRILISGVTGFVGGFLAESLLTRQDVSVHGLSRSNRWPEDLLHLQEQVPLHVVDWSNITELLEILRSIRPDWVFHLAGYAHAGKSFQEPQAAWHGNLTATRHLYEAIGLWGGRPRILYASSGLIYGDPSVGDPAFGEDAPLRPASPYAASKAAADLLSYQVTRHPGLDVVRVRCFNQIGPRQSADYAIANFARQIAAIEAGLQPPVLDTGDLTSQRDMTDVRDMVVAFIEIMENGKTGEAYNAGSGSTRTIQSVLDCMLTCSSAQIEVRSRIDLSRKGDTAFSRADIRKLRAATGWKPNYTLRETLEDTLTYWRCRQVRR